MAERTGKQSVTLELDQGILRKAQRIAEQRRTSVSELIEEQIAALAGTEDAYERAHRIALDLMKEGFRLGGKPARREELHER